MKLFRTADDAAAELYAQMKAPSPVRALYDSVQAATDDEDTRIYEAASPELQRELTAYAQRREQLKQEHAEYAEDVHNREDWLAWCRRDPKTRWAAIKRHYRNGHIGQMIDDWGWTIAPSRARDELNVRVPFRLWPRQWELCDWLWKHFKTGKPGVIAKARDCGCSWMTMAFSACLCTLYKDLIIGVVASDEDKLDSSKDPNPTLPKAREFLMSCPPELRAGFDGTTDTAPNLKVVFPETGSLIRGWTGRGDQGRGARSALMLVDEAAFFVESVDAALSGISDCRIDLSSANGTADQNNFFNKVESGDFDTFWFKISDDPRRTPEWIAEKKKTLDPVVWASEYEISFVASIDKQMFEWKWVEAAIGLLPLLEQRDGFKNTGVRRAALDVSDQGKDKNCLTISQGVLLEYLELWSGAGSNQSETCAHAFAVLDERGGIGDLVYDASAVGAGIAGAALKLNSERQRQIYLRRFIGGSTDYPNPTALARGTDRTVESFFRNLKGFAYWTLRQRLLESWKAFNGEDYDKSLVLCIHPKLPHLDLLKNELSQIQRKYDAQDRLVINKAPERQGKPRAKSPNCADSLSMLMGGCVPERILWENMLLENCGTVAPPLAPGAKKTDMDKLLEVMNSRW